MDPFTKVYRIGMAKTHGGRSYSVFVTAEYKDNRLSISGVEGPLSGGNAIGACGQIDMHLKAEDLTPAPSWTTGSIQRLLDIWDRWHLNDKHPECEHQRDLDTKEQLTLTKYTWTMGYYNLSKQAQEGRMDVDLYAEFAETAKRVHAVLFGDHTPKYETDEISALLAEGWVKADKTETKAAGWVDYREHPKGLLSKPCEVCGYGYGTAWKTVGVPDDILQELIDFPDTDREPAWV